MLGSLPERVGESRELSVPTVRGQFLPLQICRRARAESVVGNRPAGAVLRAADVDGG